MLYRYQWGRVSTARVALAATLVLASFAAACGGNGVKKLPVDSGIDGQGFVDGWARDVTPEPDSSPMDASGPEIGGEAGGAPDATGLVPDTAVPDATLIPDTEPGNADGPVRPVDAQPTIPDAGIAQADVPVPQPDGPPRVDLPGPPDAEPDSRTPDALAPDSATVDAFNVNLDALADVGGAGGAGGAGGSPGTGPITPTTSVPVLIGWPTNGIRFDLVPCGLAGSAQTFTLTNVGTGPATIVQASLAARDPQQPQYLMNAIRGSTVYPGQSLAVTITPPVVPSPLPATWSISTTIDAELRIATDIPGDTAHVIALSESPRGAIVEFVPSPADRTIDFESVPVLTSRYRDLTIRNQGNEAISINVTSSSDDPSSPFSTSLANPLQLVPAGQGPEVVERVTFTAPDFVLVQDGETRSHTGSLSLVAASGTLCRGPEAVKLQGVATKGGLNVSLTALSFSSNCGTAADPGAFTLTNRGSAAVAWTSALQSAIPSGFSVEPTSSMLPPFGAAGNSVVIHVTPPVLRTSTVVQDTLYLQGATPDDRHSVSLTATPVGGDIAVAESTLDFGHLLPEGYHTLYLNVRNNGRTLANVTLSSSNPAFLLNNSSIGVQAGDMRQVPITFRPTGGGLTPQTFSGEIQWALSSGEASCGDRSGTVAVTGTRDGDFQVEVSPLPMHMDYCPDPQHESQLMVMMTIRGLAAGMPWEGRIADTAPRRTRWFYFSFGSTEDITVRKVASSDGTSSEEIYAVDTPASGITETLTVIAGGITKTLDLTGTASYVCP